MAVLQPCTQMSRPLWSPLYAAVCLPSEGFPKTVASLSHLCISAEERAISMWLLLNVPVRFRLAPLTSTPSKCSAQSQGPPALNSSILGPGLQSPRECNCSTSLLPKCYSLPVSQYTKACPSHPDLSQICHTGPTLKTVPQACLS